MERLRVVDSHTGGEPTRVVIDGLPDLGSKPIPERVELLKENYDRYRTAVVIEPRSSPVAVGAYLLPSDRADFGVIFFNNASYLGMCGHGTIGLVTTLAHLGKVKPGEVTFETPAGLVKAVLHDDGRVSFDNVPCYRLAKGVPVELGDRQVTGDVAFGGNWFYICADHGVPVIPDNIPALGLQSQRIFDAIAEQHITADGAIIDHIELFGPSEYADARAYMRCPGGEYDRSPCGTGTCAKLACLYADGKIVEGQIWHQESIIGSTFEGSVRRVGENLIPTITGRAYVNGETTILIDPSDPFAWGIR
jgi:4-hydroxyproline epimerase